MADLTQAALETVLGVLSTAIKSEVRLQEGVERDIQFIKDEMDSMNGFLLHLTKSGNEHDDQQRAWMKQVRDVAYIAQDCIELYNLYGMTPPCNGVKAVVKFVPNYALGCWERRKLAKKITDLKDRVKDVGERRERYGVTVPQTEPKRWSDAGNGGVGTGMNKEREEFLLALQQDDEEAEKKDGATAASSLSPLPFIVSTTLTMRKWIAPPPFEEAIRKLSPELAPKARKIRRALLKYKADAESVSKKQGGDQRQLPETVAVCTGMVLRALHASPQGRVGGGTGTEVVELEKLMVALDSSPPPSDLPKRVMIFCYSELTTEEKSCLQYLAAFGLETRISRTSLVRRCTAERLVSDDKERKLTVEQKAESCFDELLFRGFISCVATGAAGKVKSCRFSSGSVRDFIEEMCKAENFVGGGLPVHLRTQIGIRGAALDQQHHPHPAGNHQQPCPFICMPVKKRSQDVGPIDKMLQELHSLPKTYRLNVMDLGGCMGILNGRHLGSICKIRTLKYLSLRNTDVAWLPSELQELRLLETLDIRQTNIPHGHGCRSQAVALPRRLKHLLAGNVDSYSQGDAPNATVSMPGGVKEMNDLEILAHVKVSHPGQLRKVENLNKLRKLGVVLLMFTPEDEDSMMKDLLRAIGRLSGCLHSLSVRMERAPINGWPTTLDGGITSSPVPSNLVSLRIDGMGTSGLPTWVERLSNLEKITLCNTLLTDQKLDTLSDLPALVCLRLRHRSYSGRALAFRKPGGFPSLRFLRVEGVLSITELTFQAGLAPPELETIVWSSAHHATNDALVAAITVSVTGIENLPKLREVVLKGLREQHPSTLAKDMEKHPNRPRFRNHAH